MALYRAKVPLFLYDGLRVPPGHVFDPDEMPDEFRASLERAHKAGFVDLVNEKIKADPLPEPPPPPKVPSWNIFD